MRSPTSRRSWPTSTAPASTWGEASPPPETFMADVARACVDRGVAALGGHSEVTAALSEPILTLTALGRAEAGRYVASSGARPGDELIVTKAAAVEGTAILATDF